MTTPSYTQASSKMYTALVCKVPTLHLISLVVWPDSLCHSAPGRVLSAAYWHFLY